MKLGKRVSEVTLRANRHSLSNQYFLSILPTPCMHIDSLLREPGLYCNQSFRYHKAGSLSVEVDLRGNLR